jgi:hypothetical protein
MFSFESGSESEAVAIELMARGDETLVRALEAIGVYVGDITVAGRDGPHGVELALAITGVLGRVAFRDRVQRPDQEAVDAVFEQLTEQMVDDEYDRHRRELGD